MQIKWCLVAVVFDFLAAIQGVRDQLLHHFCREFPIGNVEFKIFVCRTPHILIKKRKQLITTDNNWQHLDAFNALDSETTGLLVMTQISKFMYNAPLRTAVNYSTAGGSSFFKSLQFLSWSIIPQVLLNLKSIKAHQWTLTLRKLNKVHSYMT
jgi:hypothetical protein